MSAFRPLLLASLLGALLSAAIVAQQGPRWHGVQYSLPKGWTAQVQDEVLVLIPAGVAPDGTSGEGYGMLFDNELASVQGEELLEALEAAAEQMLEGSRKKSDRVGPIGAVSGRTVVFSRTYDNNATVDLRFACFPAEGGVAAIFIVGEVGKLKARDGEIAALLDSIGKDAAAPKRKPFGLGRKKAGDGDEKGGEKGNEEVEGGEPAETETPVEESGRDEPKSGGNPLLRRKPGGDPKADSDKPSFVRIPGARELKWCGIAIDVPADWKTQAGDEDAMLLMPPGFGESGVLDEIYALAGDGSLKSLDAADTNERIQEALDEIQPGLLPQGSPQSARFGAIAGKEFAFRGETPTGDPVAAVLYAFPTAGGVRALLALGYPSKLEARRALIRSMLGSMRPLAGAKSGGASPQELCGTWQYFASVTANNGGGSSNEARFTLNPDGTYVYSAENCSTNPFGAAWGNARSRGRWTATADSITFTDDTGSTTYGLEKRNHPRNRDPMLVLDGKSFVTVYQKRPW
ncbi:MAG: hypothetical protein AB7I19_16795 [Planctomycetota bacterium]